MTIELSSTYTSYAVPKLSGECLIAPELGGVLSQLQQPSKISGTGTRQDSLQSNPFLGQWRDKAKNQIVSLARSYTSGYRNTDWLDDLNHDGQPQIVLSGHQPELFHCGVWFKNFLISKIAELSGAVGINFIVDNDLCRAPGIFVPTVKQNLVATQFIAFDKAVDSTAWETRSIIDVDIWHTFASRVERVLPPIAGQPIVAQLWQQVLKLDRKLPIGLILSQARHLLEEQLRQRTLEVPLSQLCNTDSFAAFSLYLLSRSAELCGVYNSELAAYRAAHRIRNHAQPLPSLEFRDGWQEIPWWCYSDTSDRKPMYIKKQDGLLLLSDLGRWQGEIHGPLDGDSAIEQWLAFASQGIRIRPRALMTTMFTRLLMSDLFVHGIGGGKYDQITDRIIAQVFGVSPPGMVVASATMRLEFRGLPNDLVQSIEPRLNATQSLYNSASANPEILLGQTDSVEISDEALHRLQELANDKKRLLASIPSKGDKWEWHIAMKKIKQQLSDVAGSTLESLARQLEELKNLHSHQQVLNSREFSYCLFDKDDVQSQFAKSL